MLQSAEPKRVRNLPPDGEYAFVEGSETGVRVSELLPEKAPVGFSRTPAPELKNAPSSQNHMKEDVFSLADVRASSRKTLWHDSRERVRWPFREPFQISMESSSVSRIKTRLRKTEGMRAARAFTAASESLLQKRWLLATFLASAKYAAKT